MDCPICYNLLTNSCIGSCCHHFCLGCLIKWCEHGGTSCPVCKTLISEIRPDIEFNKINCPENPNISTENLSHCIIVNFSKNESAGITLENNSSFGGFGKRGPGVVITKIDNKKNCYVAGLREGDILLFINNVPCVNHKQSVDIIDNSVKMNVSINCVLLKIKKNY